MSYRSAPCFEALLLRSQAHNIGENAPQDVGTKGREACIPYHAAPRYAHRRCPPRGLNVHVGQG
jgi:hypothetical protein